MRCSLYGPYPDPDPADYARCECGGYIAWVDEIIGDQGTDMLISVCEDCGEEYKELGPWQD
jgi:hypothetical protein